MANKVVKLSLNLTNHLLFIGFLITVILSLLYLQWHKAFDGLIFITLFLLSIITLYSIGYLFFRKKIYITIDKESFTIHGYYSTNQYLWKDIDRFYLVEDYDKTNRDIYFLLKSQVGQNKHGIHLPHFGDGSLDEFIEFMSSKLNDKSKG